jgi:hypothetical protein
MNPELAEIILNNCETCDCPECGIEEMSEEESREYSHPELIERQLAEILGEDNRRYATHAIGREPSLGELIYHYAQNGGPEDFERRHGKKTCIVRISFE